MPKKDMRWTYMVLILLIGLILMADAGKSPRSDQSVSVEEAASSLVGAAENGGSPLPAATTPTVVDPHAAKANLSEILNLLAQHRKTNHMLGRSANVTLTFADDATTTFIPTQSSCVTGLYAWETVYKNHTTNAMFTCVNSTLAPWSQTTVTLATVTTTMKSTVTVTSHDHATNTLTIKVQATHPEGSKAGSSRQSSASITDTGRTKSDAPKPTTQTNTVSASPAVFVNQSKSTSLGSVDGENSASPTGTFAFLTPHFTPKLRSCTPKSTTILLGARI